MIYFEFTISRAPLSINESEFDLPTAEFMFDCDSPAECTRQAVLLLKTRGWLPVSVKQACEGFTVEDFHLGERVTVLYGRAQAAGIGFQLNEKEDVKMVSRELV